MAAFGVAITQRQVGKPTHVLVDCVYNLVHKAVNTRVVNRSFTILHPLVKHSDTSRARDEMK
jgi:hypothetical protein